MSLTSELKSYGRGAGADAIGIADLEDFREGIETVPPDLLTPYRYAVSIALRLPDPPLDGIVDRPTAAYAALYRDVNARLDRIAHSITAWITDQGYKAAAIPASAILDDDRLLGAVSHKAVAGMAGIGWQGKSLLIVSPDFGPSIRLVTVLTDMLLEADAAIGQRCGSCTACVEACPVSAIRGEPAAGRYASRDEALFFSRCAERTRENAGLDGIGARICGVCVRACPFGLQKK